MNKYFIIALSDHHHIENSVWNNLLNHETFYISPNVQYGIMVNITLPHFFNVSKFNCLCIKRNWINQILSVFLIFWMKCINNTEAFILLICVASRATQNFCCDTLKYISLCIIYVLTLTSTDKISSLLY